MAASIFLNKCYRPRFIFDILGSTRSRIRTQRHDSVLQFACASVHTFKFDPIHLSRARNSVVAGKGTQTVFTTSLRLRPIRFLGTTISGSRLNSSSSNAGNINETESLNYIPPPPSFIPPTPDSVLIEPVLNTLSEPSLSSLGLGGYWPHGIAQTTLEYIHTSIGLPWWGSIVLLTVALRTCMFPVMAIHRKNLVLTLNHKPELQKYEKYASPAEQRRDEYEAVFGVAQQRGDKVAASEGHEEMKKYQESKGISGFKGAVMPFMQVPVFISMFFALRGMAELPVESMTTGGVLWFTDLTVPGPFYGLPLLTSLTLLATLETGSETSSKASSQMTKIKWIIRGSPFVALPFFSYFPSSLLVYWLTSNSCSLLQVLVFKIPALERALGIPELIVHPKVESEVGLRLQDGVASMKAVADAKYREKMDNIEHRVEPLPEPPKPKFVSKSGQLNLTSKPRRRRQLSEQQDNKDS